MTVELSGGKGADECEGVMGGQGPGKRQTASGPAGRLERLVRLRQQNGWWDPYGSGRRPS